MPTDSTDVREIRIRLSNGFGFGFFVGLGFFASQLVFAAGISAFCIAVTFSGCLPSLFKQSEDQGLAEPPFVPSVATMVVPSNCPAVDPNGPTPWNNSAPATPTRVPPPPYPTEIRPVPVAPGSAAPALSPAANPYHSKPTSPAE